MPYVGGRIAALFDDEPAGRAAHRIAAKGGEKMTAYAEFETPVDTGKLRRAWRTKAVVKHSTPEGEVYESGTENHTDYALFVEVGTGLWGPRGAKYEIKPKVGNQFLSWIDPRSGRRVYRRRVMHPGAAGFHMTEIAAGLTERTMSVWAAPILDEWVREQEGLV